jgi:hypothetical protein
MKYIILLGMLLSFPSHSDEIWRSSLYPENWTPGFKDSKGRFLHDFSYAGYRNGESKPGIPANIKRFNVLDFGADPKGEKDSQSAIQNAVKEAEKNSGGVIFLPSGLYKLEKPVYIKRSNVIIKGDGPDKTKLFFTCHKKMTGKSQINFTGGPLHGKEYLLKKEGEALSFFVELESVNGLKKGMDVDLGFVITDDFRKDFGMEEYWTFAKNKWRTFFRRNIVEIDRKNKKVFLDVPLRCDMKLRDKASLRISKNYISECAIQDLSISDAVGWNEAWNNNRVHAICMSGVKDCWMKNVKSFDSPLEKAKGLHLQSCGVIIRNSKRVTISDCYFSCPQHRGGGGNGYLFEISKSCEILIRDCIGKDGRHNFIQNWDFNTNGCVFLRIKSSGSRVYKVSWDFIGFPAASEFHHALAMANLIDSSEINDGWYSRNRGNWSSKAGHTATENVLWNISGKGLVISSQYGWGYLIGTRRNIKTQLSSQGSMPEDFVEGQGRASTLRPQSLYEDQLRKRTEKSGLTGK